MQYCVRFRIDVDGVTWPENQATVLHLRLAPLNDLTHTNNQ